MPPVGGKRTSLASYSWGGWGAQNDIGQLREVNQAGQGIFSPSYPVVPIQPETAMASVPWTFPQRAVAIVLVSDPETEMQARVESLRDRFGLTPAEATFALEIIKGDGRQATADRLGITVGTARSHLSSIFDKTGSRRQAELVRLLLDI